jgi:hypothetical protein
MDPKRYTNPREIDPSRYINDHRTARELTLCPNPKERDHCLFGAGRRVCMGLEIGKNSLFLAMARLVWAFNISKAVDREGNEITPDQEALEGGLAAMPKPFPAKIFPRSEKHAEVIKQNWDLAQQSLNRSDKQWKDVPRDLKFGKD